LTRKMRAAMQPARRLHTADGCVRLNVDSFRRGHVCKPNVFVYKGRPKRRQGFSKGEEMGYVLQVFRYSPVQFLGTGRGASEKVVRNQNTLHHLFLICPTQMTSILAGTLPAPCCDLEKLPKFRPLDTATVLRIFRRRDIKSNIANECGSCGSFRSADRRNVWRFERLGIGV